MRTLIGAVVGVATLSVAGCGGGTADVAGKVTYQGKPVVFGTVQVIGPDGVPKSGAIQQDGTYRVAGVKVGSATVTVSSPPPPGSKGAPMRKAGRDGIDEDKKLEDETVDPEIAKTWFPLPDRYGDPGKSGLTADVGSGKPLDLDLK